RTLSPALADAALTFSLAGPLAVGSHTVAVVAADAAANQGSASATFTVATAGLPGAGPANLALSSINQHGLRLSWQPPARPSGTVTYAVTRDGTAAGTTHGLSVYVSGLSCGTTYAFAVTAATRGAAPSVPGAISGTTTACPDTTPPSVVFTSSVLTGTGPSVN